MCCKICFRTKICYKTLCETSHRSTTVLPKPILIVCQYGVFIFPFVHIYTWKKIREHPLFQICFNMDSYNSKTIDKTQNIISPLCNMEEYEVKMLSQQCQLPYLIACKLISFIIHQSAIESVCVCLSQVCKTSMLYIILKLRF